MSGRTHTEGTASAKAPRQTCAAVFQELVEQGGEMRQEVSNRETEAGPLVPTVSTWAVTLSDAGSLWRLLSRVLIKLTLASLPKVFSVTRPAAAPATLSCV